VTLDELKSKGEAAEWMTEESYQTISNGYLQPNETPRQAYERVAYHISNALNKPEMQSTFFDIMWKNWFCPSSPVLSNTGTKNLPISCYAGQPAEDSTFELFNHNTEMGMLTKFGGGVGSYFGNIRSKGHKISSGGTTDGIIPFLKMLETTVDGTKQGASRRGSVASYLPFEHGDIEEFINVRNPKGDLNRKCLTTSFHNAVTINDDTMNAIINGDKHYRKLWQELMTQRVETGEPYILYRDNFNKNCPSNYMGKLEHSNLCSEIALPTSSTETFVCCLSSLNLDRYREWENWKSPEGYTLTQLSIMMLDGVITLFVNQAKNMQGLSKAVRFAERHRALGLGVLGWHSLLQKEMISFASFKAMMLNGEIFSKMRREADEMTRILAKEYGECEETLGTGRRNTVTLAIAPTMSNSILSGGVSQGIEPITANLFVQKSAKGNFIRRNKYLEQLLESKGLNTFEIWDQINKDMGSVRNLKQLSDDEKSVFLTAREIDQYAIIQQAAQRQRYIDQAQSINLFFALPKSKEDQLKVAKYINEVHVEAWKLGIKSLYYLKTASPIKGQNLIVDKESSCLSCEG